MHYDLFVIGAGSGGVAAGRRASALGAKVGICEEYRIGGTCVIRGCVPKKLLVASSNFSENLSDSYKLGWSINEKKIEANFSWKNAIKNIQNEVDRLNGIYINMLNKAGVKIYEGFGKFIDKKTVSVNGDKITADKFLIATGATPYLPNIAGIEHAITSNEAFLLESLPKNITVVGAGYIAVEFAGIFNGMGAETNLVYRGDKILRGFDKDIRSHLEEELIKKNIDIKLNTDIEKIEKNNKSYTVFLNNGKTIETDLVMYATGRKPNIKNLGLEAVGIKSKNGLITVDDNFETNIKNVFALGDVANTNNLTPVAINEAIAFVQTQFNNNPKKMDYNLIPSAIFSQPEASSVGLSEEEAKEQYKKIDIYKSSFRPLKNNVSGNEERSMMKLIVDHKTQKVLGAHMVGENAAEIMQGVAIALKCGATKEDFDKTVGIHPSSAEEFVTMREVSYSL